MSGKPITQTEPLSPEMAQLMREAGIKYRFDKELRVVGKMIIPVGPDGQHYCIECDHSIDATVYTQEELDEMHRRNFGTVPQASVAMCDECHERVLEFFRSRQ